MAPESAPHGTPRGSNHYFDASPASASRPSTVELALPDGSFRLETDRGVFSPGRVDPGTKILLVETSPEVSGTAELPPGDLVDLGAGYGPVTVALASRFPDRRIWAVEPNERARGLCRANAARNCPQARIEVVAPEEVPPDLRVAGITSNPPIRVGKPALHALLEEWLARLVPGGTAWLVVQKHLGADSLAGWLRTGGHEVRRVASRKGYRVLEVTPGASPPD